MNVEPLNLRTMKRRIGELEEFMPIAVESHLKYVTHEEDEEVRREAEAAWKIAMDEAEEVFDDAGEKYDTLVAQPEEPAITEDQEENIAQTRITTAMKKIEQRLKLLKDGIDSLPKPANKGKLDRYHDMIADLRRDAPEILSPAFVPLYLKATLDPDKTL